MSTLPLILPLAQNYFTRYATHIVLYQFLMSFNDVGRFYPIFYVTIKFFLYHFMKSWVKECHHFPDTPASMHPHFQLTKSMTQNQNQMTIQD